MKPSFCPFCGNEISFPNNAGAATCMFCFHRVEASAASSEQHVQQAAVQAFIPPVIDSPSHPERYFCFACGQHIDRRAEVCPKCGVRQSRIGKSGGKSDASGTKTAAGVLAILLGCLGVHKFVIGATVPGVVMLLVSLLTFGVGAVPMGIIGLIEGIIYLTKTDEEFHERYIVGKRGWF